VECLEINLIAAMCTNSENNFLPYHNFMLLVLRTHKIISAISWIKTEDDVFNTGYTLILYASKITSVFMKITRGLAACFQNV
jgi:hypothetical protein